VKLRDHVQAQENPQRNQSDSPHQRGGLGSVQCTSESDGIESIAVDPANSSRSNTSRSNFQHSNIDAGKILERLEFLESEYITYVQEQQQILEARLEESKQRELKFKEKLQELRQQIFDLTLPQEQDQASENSTLETDDESSLE
jgi:hypothetical protein